LTVDWKTPSHEFGEIIVEKKELNPAGSAAYLCQRQGNWAVQAGKQPEKKPDGRN